MNLALSATPPAHATSDASRLKAAVTYVSLSPARAGVTVAFPGEGRVWSAGPGSGKGESRGAGSVRLCPDYRHERAGRQRSQGACSPGVITGIGFIGGGAIVKQGSSVKGLVTAAGIWNAGAIGVAVGLGVANIAIILGLTNLFGLVAAEHARRSRSRR
ncbi:hypothetical protein ACVMB3_004621 [Sinorhizobium meliloti]|uniref:MgtC/SapB family protein n=1 Tax=Rhizobium meliloti TaxID=382 RepID=UPI00398994B5